MVVVETALVLPGKMEKGVKVWKIQWKIGFLLIGAMLVS